jgi:hypothetical protein
MKKEVPKNQSSIIHNGILDEFKEFEQSIKLFTDIRTIVIPKHTEEQLRMKRFEKELLQVHQDKNLAIEYCLVFLSNFAHIHYDYNNQDKWKPLYSKILLEQIPGSNATYKKVIKLLLMNIFSSSPMIEVKKNKKGTPSYEVGINSIQYRLSNRFSKNGYIKYTITSDSLIKQRLKVQYRNMKDVTTNLIARNLLTVYPKVTLPTAEEIFIEAKQLVKNKFTNNKGKKLTILNGRKKSDLKDFSKRVSYDDSLMHFNYLTVNGFLIPTISGRRAGGRVYDSFNLMPSFIRNLIKIDRENVVTIDFKCLHPNLSMKLYNGNSKYLTHQFIAEQLKLDVMEVKIEHLSFFNMEISQMKLSPLFDYYRKNEPQMLENLIEDKNKNGYRITCEKMFNLEVKIMIESIKKLNEIDIYPLYIFDALLVKCSDQNETELILNDVLKEMDIYTIGVKS